MIKHDKQDGDYVDIPAVFTSSTGELAEPDTSFKLYLYPANSETVTLNGVDLDEVGTSGGFSYTWDVSAVAVGNYYGFIIAVDDSKTYPTAVSVEITDSEYIVTNLDVPVSEAGQGNGGITQPIYVNDTDGTREGGVKVEIFSNADMAEANRLTGNIFTDDAGQIVVNLNAGTYYLRASKSGKTFSNPITITVVA